MDGWGGGCTPGQRGTRQLDLTFMSDLKNNIERGLRVIAQVCASLSGSFDNLPWNAVPLDDLWTPKCYLAVFHSPVATEGRTDEMGAPHASGQS